MTNINDFHLRSTDEPGMFLLSFRCEMSKETAAALLLLLAEHEKAPPGAAVQAGPLAPHGVG